MRTVIFFCLFAVTASADYNSAVRYPGETFETARARLEAEASRAGRDINAGRTPMGSAGFLSSLDYRYSPQYANMAEVTAAFEAARDQRYFAQDDFPGYFRRLTWLFPDDGCYARAEITTQKLAARGFSKPAKVFALGVLSVATTNHPAGEVMWVYHVAPVVNVGVQAFVLDPALEPDRPLGVFEWFGRMRGTGTTANIRAMICQGGTYGPFDDCDTPKEMAADQSLRDMRPFLGREWTRQLELLRNPAGLLLGLLDGVL